MTMTQFSSVLANQLINNVDCLLSFYSPISQELRSIVDAPSNITVSNTTQENSSSTSTLAAEHLQLSIPHLTDANGTDHHQIAYEIGTGITGKRRTKTRPCVLCLQNNNKRRLVGFGCFTCGFALCCPTKQNQDRDCFQEHVNSVCRRSERQV
jgi:hypothetical protein